MEACCAKVVIRGMAFHRTKPCKFKATVQRDGKWYCKRHDPVASAEKKEKTFKKNQKLAHIYYLAKLKVAKDRREGKM